MGFFRFRRRFRILPGITLNRGKRVVSASLGARGAWLTALALAMPCATAGAAESQVAPIAPPDASIAEEVLVTGTRLQATGFETPTPVTAVTATGLRAAGPRNLADALVQLPAFNGSTRSEVPVSAATIGYNGQNLLNLRGLGPTRTLVLLDGRRLPTNNALGAVDINMLPQSLVKAVDVVTGGASAAYGSDAVAGVVNFVLDTHLEGLKSELQGGLSSHDDLPSRGLSLAFGHAFLDGRARIVASVEAASQAGLGPVAPTGRTWFDVPAGQIPNPAMGLPKTLVITDIRNGLGTYGGLIPSGPLKGTEFLPGGATTTFRPGSIVSSTFQSGGDGGKINIGFSPDQRRITTFVHGEIDTAEHLTLFAEGHLARTHVTANDIVNPQVGTANQFTIFRNNAYLPAPVLARMVAGGVQSFPLGRFERDFPVVQIEDITDMKRVVLGGRGKLGGSWRYELSGAYGQTDQEIAENNLTINRRLYAAADAVRNSAGQIVCRSTLAGLDPGCVPLNLFGAGSPSAAAISYVTGNSIKYLKLRQTVAALDVHGDLGERFQLSAGPIAVATGLEYRKESANQTVDPLSPLVTDFTGVRGGPLVQQGRPGAFNFFNPLPFSGSYTVKEGYLEVGVPLVKQRPWFHALNFDAAARRSDYTQSGGVTTWKAGLNWELNGDLRLRLTKSRDIRGPNLQELFNTPIQNSNNQIYQGRTTPTLQFTAGNPDLTPEKAITLTYGVVYRPSWLTGLQLSLDRYDIAISNAIGVLTPQQEIDQCAAGNALLCSQFTVTPQGTLRIKTNYLNLSIQKVAGYDFEAAYVAALAGGQLTLHVLANHETAAYSQVPGSAILPTLGETTTPRWRGTVQAAFARGSWSGFVQERYISRSVFDATKVEGIDTSLNTTPAIFYADLSLSYRLGWTDKHPELFGTVNNVFNREPPIATLNPTTFSTPTTIAYDRIGRYYTAGLRFQF